MSRVNSPKSIRRYRASTPYTTAQGSALPVSPSRAPKNSSGTAIPQFLVPMPTLSPPFISSDIHNVTSEDPFGGFVPSPILDRSLVPSGTAPKGPALPLKATCEWSERSPGLHKWLRSVLEHKDEQPLTPGRIVGCRICRKPMSDVAHLHEHTSRLWRTILLDEPMALRDLVLAIQFVVAKDMAADQVFKQDENRAFATFFWNYDSLDGLDETVRFSDDIDKDCIGPFKDRVHAWAMKARSNPLYPCDLAQLHL